MAEITYGDGGDFFGDGITENPWSVMKPTDQASAAFLQILDEIKPDALNQLKSTVYPLLPDEFTKFVGMRGLAARLAYHLKERMQPSQEVPAQHLERLKQFNLLPDQLFLDDPELETEFQNLKQRFPEPIDALTDWATSFQISGRPVIQLVIESLADWKYHELKGFTVNSGKWGVRVEYLADPERDSKEWDLRILLGGSVDSLDAPVGFEFRLKRPWDPFQERWSQAEARIKQEFEAELAEYRQRVEELAERRGSKAPRKRTPAEHFRWLVQYQIDGLSYAKIAEEHGKRRTTVSEGVQSAAALIELSLRPPKRGRPPGSSDSRWRHRANS